MQLKISGLVLCLCMGVVSDVSAETIADEIQRQQNQAASEKVRMENMTVAINTVSHQPPADNDVPMLFSVMAMGKQCVLKFVTSNGKYIVTEKNPDIGSKWKLVKADGLSAVIQHGKDAPIRVFLSIPDDVQGMQAASTAAPMNTSLPPPPMTPSGMIGQGASR